MAWAVVENDDVAEGGNGFVLNAGGGEVAVQDLFEQGLVATALAGAVCEVRDGTDDEDIGTEVAEGRGDLVGCEAGVQGHEDGAELEDGVGEGGKRSAVAEGDGDAVALADSELGQGMGEAVGQKVELGVGEARLRGGDAGGGRDRGARDDGWVVPVLRDGGGEVLGDGAGEEGGLGSELAFEAGGEVGGECRRGEGGVDINDTRR